MSRKISPSSSLDFDKVWIMFQETKQLLSEKFLETDRKFLETDLKFRETDKKFQETDKRIKELAGLFTTQWGKLIEALVEPSCLKLFQERGIQIEQSFQNVRAIYKRRDMECDILLVNATELVVVEIKTTFRPDYATAFVDKLSSFKLFFPQYKDYKIMGAVAALKYEGQSDKFAYRNGLFVLRCSGDGIIKIVNDKKFVPRNF